MRILRATVLAALVSVNVTCSCAAPALALAGTPGGARAPAGANAGGTQFGTPLHLLASRRPVLNALHAPATVTAGGLPLLTLRLSEQGVNTVYLQVKVIDLATHHSSLIANMGWVHTGRTLTVSWPAGAQLAPGSYELAVSVHDHQGIGLLHAAHSSGGATLTVSQSPELSPAPPSGPPVGSEAGVPTPAQSVADGAVFPVVGPHNFGGPENRYGAPREGHIHQGQDVLTREGTPDVAPLAGRIESTSYQSGGAGYYIVEHTDVGFDFMFAHCEAASFVVSAGESVPAGQLLCKAGQTGDATTPHLHFEMWVGGWQAPGGHPIDPLPYLEAWEQAGTAG